jgi:hypothetical protein
MLRFIVAFIGLLVLFGTASTGVSAGTVVPGHERWDQDNNGIPDAGVYVNGHYTSLYAYDADGAYYWDLGDGRIYTSPASVDGVDDLDQDSLTVCDYVINYRADFGNTPYMDAGWIQNHILCTGYEGPAQYNYLIVHESDPRYTGNPDWAEWGNWEYHVLTESGSGNLTRVGPQNHIP